MFSYCFLLLLLYVKLHNCCINVNFSVVATIAQ